MGTDFVFRFPVDLGRYPLFSVLMRDQRRINASMLSYNEEPVGYRNSGCKASSRRRGGVRRRSRGSLIG
jgi:hypothetical protein